MESNVNKSNILNILNKDLRILNINTIDIINASNILSDNNIEHKVIQGWKVNKHKEYNREAYLFIELKINNKNYYLNILDSIHLSRENIKGVFKKKPSDKYIASRLNKQ